MIIDDMVKHAGSWLALDQNSDIVVSSRIRLARNIKGAAFPGWAGEEECVRLCDRLRGILEALPSLPGSRFLDMAKTTPLDKEVLRERQLISNEFSERGTGSGLVVTPDEHVAAMINEEDHLRLQAISPGMNLPAIWKRISQVDLELEEHVDFAFSAALGYLTACPSNVGTGLRASVMLHVPGLKLIHEMEPVMKGLTRMRLAVRGLHGEGTEASGNMIQVSNQATLGESEDVLIGGLVKVVEQVILFECHARARLMESRRSYVMDQVGRAYGLLLNARMLASAEAVDLLSLLKLGIDLELIGGITNARVNEIILLTQPGHLQKMAGRALEPEERDEVRSEIVREKLKTITVTGRK